MRALRTSVAVAITHQRPRRSHGRRHQRSPTTRSATPAHPTASRSSSTTSPTPATRWRCPVASTCASCCPQTVYPDTLVLRENGERVANYRLNRSTGQPTIKWQSATDPASCATSRWSTCSVASAGARPTTCGSVPTPTRRSSLDYFAEITDSALELDDVETQLVAGMVDLIQPHRAGGRAVGQPEAGRLRGCRHARPSPRPSVRSTSSTPTTSAR